MARQVTIAVIGKSRLGNSIVSAIRSKRRSHKLLTHLPARSKSFNVLGRDRGPDILFIVCKDKYISEVATRALESCGPRTKLIIHCAGSLPSDILPKRKGLLRLMLHPIQTFTKDDPASFQGIAFGVESTDKAGFAYAQKIVTSLGGKEIIKLRAKDLALYHAAMVIAANFITLLGASVEELSKKIGISPSKFKRAVTPLMRQSLENVLAQPAHTVLTGPLARGDKETIKRHKAALAKTKSKEIYDAFVRFAEANIKI
jgi:predicted short-subunit dehydrogenase-like oxidoreductase (DUF2520 family)